MPTKDTEGDALLKAMNDSIRAVKNHVFPELIEVTVEDDGEIYQALRCQVCDGLVDDDSLAAVSVDQHWCYNEPIGDWDMDHQRITFDSDIDRDLGDTVLYLHNDDHAVSLPDGWTEEWS